MFRYARSAMITVIRLFLLVVFAASVATLLFFPRPSDPTFEKDGRYFARYYRSTVYEMTRDQYEENNAVAWRGRVRGAALLTMYASLGVFIALESIRLQGRHIITRSNRPGARVRSLKLPMSCGRGGGDH
jgi:hypothetical protein